MIKLNKLLFLGRGGERDCYIHPEDSKKVIKIIYQKGKHNNQNTLDYKYYKFLEKEEVNFSLIPKCFDWVETNLGQGLTFERIENYDNTKVRTLSFYVKHNLFDREYDLKLIKELKKYLFENNILFVDASLSNIFCQKISKSNYKLIIFDGLGGRRPGFKFWLYLRSKYFRSYKISKQWKKFLENYENEKNLNIALKDKEMIEY